MILDEDVRQFFRNKLGKPCIFGGYGSLQIYRGISDRLWKDAHPGGCARHHSVFNNFGAIPEYCFDCYKVLVTPRTVVELFKLLMVFERLILPNDNTRKCMAEGRHDCGGAYKGFIYCQSIEEGKNVHNIVRNAVAGDIAPEVPVALKRGCSEFAAAYPAYSPTEPDAVFMEYNKDWKVHEDFVDRNSIFNTKVPAAQAVDNTTYSPAEIFAMHYWLRYAATIGDISYLKITGCTLPPIPDLKRPPFADV
ncbi:MAG: hypothetical protein ACYC1T_04080 [Sulfuricaulis sp.]